MFCLNSPAKGKRKLAGKRFAHEKALLCKDFDLIKANHNQSTWVVTLMECCKPSTLDPMTSGSQVGDIIVSSCINFDTLPSTRKNNFLSLFDRFCYQVKYVIPTFVRAYPIVSYTKCDLN